MKNENYVYWDYHFIKCIISMSNEDNDTTQFYQQLHYTTLSTTRFTEVTKIIINK